MGGGVSGAILRKAGKNIKEETIKLAPIKLGDVAITNAGNLSAKYIFHGAVLDYQLYYKLKSQKPDINVIQEVTKKCLKLAESVNAQSIAFPALATGTGGLAPEQSALGIIIEIIKFLKCSTSLKTIIIAIYGHQNSNLVTIKDIKSHFLNQVSHFIDLYQQMETRYELLEDLENIFKSYNIELAESIISKYQEKLTEIMNKYINNITNNFE